MRKIVSILLLLTMVFSMTACTSDKGNDGESADGVKPYKAALLLNGNLGDKSFLDSANEGMLALKEELGKDKFDFKVVEMGAGAQNQSKWAPTMLDYCDGKEYDVIICGTWEMAKPLLDAAKQFPDQKFIYFDEDLKNYIAEGEGIPKNIYNVLYKQNEISFVVGAIAAKMTTDENLTMVDPSNKIIGFLGGQENATIYDFLMGYVQGAKYVDPETEVKTAYVGDFQDSAKGKDLALTQYQNGVDVGFNVAGQAGIGQIEAAVEAKRYAFGVDSDQAALLPNMAANIPSSAIKNVGGSLARAIKFDMNNKLEYGTAEMLGFAENGVALAEGKNYEEVVPQEIRDFAKQVMEDIGSGKIIVESSRGKTSEEITEFLNK